MLTPLFLLKKKKIIEQNNFINNSLHIIGQQLDQIEEKIEKPTSSKTEKPSIDLPSQRQTLSLKTTQKKKKKKEAKQNTSTSATHAISRKREEIGFFEDSWPIWS